MTNVAKLRPKTVSAASDGIRAGELSGMRIQDVTLDRITVEQSVWGGEDQVPKSQNAVRTIARKQSTNQTRLFSVSTGSPLDMDVERSRRLAPILQTLDLPKAGYHAFRHFNVSMMDALRVPLKTIQERIGHALTGSFTLDVYGHTLDWKANEDAARGLGDELRKAVAEVQSKQQDKSVDSALLSTLKKKTSKLRSLEVIEKI
jgi:integrase